MNKKAVGTIAIAAALIAALAVPVFAEAGLRNGRLKDKRAVAAAKKEATKAREVGQQAAGSSEASRTAAKEQRKADARRSARPRRGCARPQQAQGPAREAHLQQARRPQAPLHAVNANLTKRINRIASLATTVAAAGGDVSAVNAKLDSARAHLAAATRARAGGDRQVQGDSHPPRIAGPPSSTREPRAARLSRNSSSPVSRFETPLSCCVRSSRD